MAGVDVITLPGNKNLRQSAPCSDLHKKAMRAVLGALQWHATQCAPWLSASVSIL